MVATLVLEASAERRVGSSPTWGTNMREWWNGIHSRLKICRRKAYGFESRLSHHEPLWTNFGKVASLKQRSIICEFESHQGYH